MDVTGQTFDDDDAVLWGLPRFIFHVSHMTLSPYEPELQEIHNIIDDEDLIIEANADAAQQEIPLKVVNIFGPTRIEKLRGAGRGSGREAISKPFRRQSPDQNYIRFAEFRE